MTAPVGSGEKVEVSRIAPSGVPVDLTLPAVLGDYRWYGNTRFADPRLARQFFLAPACALPEDSAAAPPDPARPRRKKLLGGLDG